MPCHRRARVRRVVGRRCVRPNPVERPTTDSGSDALASDRSVPRRAGEIRHRRAAALECLLHRLRQRRRLDDERLRPHVEADFRRPADRIDRRHRRCAVRSQCDLRRQRRRHRAARPLHRRRHLQIDRRGEDVDAPRPSRRPADSVHRRRPARRQSPVRCGAGPSVRAERRARRLPIDRRRTNVSESVLQGREHRRVGPRARSAESRVCGRRVRVRGRTAPGTAPTAASSNRPTAARPGVR